MCWSFSSTQASLVPNGGSRVLVLSACAKAVCRIYVPISLPTIVQLASRPRATGLCCAPSIWAELATWPDLPYLKHLFSGHIVWGWLVELNPRGYTSGRPSGLGRCRPRGLRGHPAPRILGGTARLWGRSAPGRRWCALPRHRKSLSCMRC